MSRRRTAAEMRYAEIDYILSNWEAHLRTRDNILAHLDEKVPHPQPGGAWSYETFNNDKKDMDHLTDGAAEIEYKYGKDPAGKKVGFYAYKNEDFKWADVGSDPRMLRALQLARKILAPYNNLPAIQDLSAYTKTIERQIGKCGGATAPVPIYFSKASDINAIPEIWEPILEAAAERKLLKITYRAGWNRTVREKTIKPYSIICLEGEWYIYGTRDSGSDELWQHKISRVKKAKALTRTFSIPEDFDAEGALNHTLGKFVGNESRQTVRVLLKNRVAALAAEEKFHPKQKDPPETTHDGVIIEFDVSDAGEWPFYNVVRWVLSWGRDAEVLGPPELKRLVTNEIKLMAEI